MRNIINPYTKREGFACFGCSPDNPIGMHLQFFEDGDYLVSTWKPDEKLQGYKDILHGGIQTLLLDEIASWVVYVKAGTAGVTSNLSIKFLKPVFIPGNELTIKAKIMNRSKRIVSIRGELYNKEQILCAEADIEYFVYDPEFARAKLFYPGVEAFFEDQ